MHDNTSIKPGSVDGEDSVVRQKSEGGNSAVPAVHSAAPFKAIESNN